MATFGNTVTGVLWSSNWANYKGGSRYTLAEAGSVSKLTVRIGNDDTGHAACNITGLVYSDTDGEPDELLGATNATTVANDLTERWLDCTFASPVVLDPGSYWLCIIGDGTAAGGFYWMLGTNGPGGYNVDTYGGPPATPTDPFGTRTAELTRSYCIYATYTPTTTRTFDHPGLLLSSTELSAAAARVADTGSPAHDSWDWYVADGYISSDTTSHAFAGPVDWADWSEWQTAYYTTCSSDLWRTQGWAWAYHFDPGSATTYATRVRDMLLSWAAVWVPNRESDCVTCDTLDDKTQLASDQDAILFKFALAYDLTRNDAVYSAGNRTTINAWLADCADRQFSFVPLSLRWNDATGTGNWANDHNVYDYEWRPTAGSYLHYRCSDRYGPGGDALLRTVIGGIACAYAADYYPGVAVYTTDLDGYYSGVAYTFRSHYTTYTSFVDHVLADVLTPGNEGDYRDKIGTYAPVMMICKAPAAGQPDTTDYCMYNLQMAAILALVSGNLYAQLGTAGAAEDYAATWTSELTASWEYMARLFEPDAVSTPVYAYDTEPHDEAINYAIDKARFPIGWSLTDSEIVAGVCLASEDGVTPANIVETQYLGPTTILWTADEPAEPPDEPDVVGGGGAVEFTSRAYIKIGNLNIPVMG